MKQLLPDKGIDNFDFTKQSYLVSLKNNQAVYAYNTCPMFYIHRKLNYSITTGLNNLLGFHISGNYIAIMAVFYKLLLPKNVVLPIGLPRCFNKTFYIVFFILLFVLSNSATAAKQLVIGYSHYPPFQWTDDKGQASGVDIDIINAILADSGFTSSFKKMPWTRQLQVGIKNGELDILMQAKRTQVRDSFAYFSKQMYMKVDNALFIRKEDIHKFRHIKRLKDLIDTPFTIGAIRGSVYSEEHQSLLSNPAFTQHIVELSRDEQSINMLLSGRINAFLATDLSIVYALKGQSQKNNVALHMYLNEADRLHQGSLFMFSKATMNVEQVQRINTSLIKLLDNGTIKNILSSYGFSMLSAD